MNPTTTHVDTVQNPFLNDDVQNPFLDDDEYYPERPTEAEKEPWSPTAIAQASKAGEARREALNARGIAAPGQKSRSSSKGIITLSPQDMKALEFIAISQITGARQVATATGNSEKTSQRRLRKLERMGATWSFLGGSGKHYHALTPQGIRAVLTHGLLREHHVKRVNPTTAAWEKLGHGIAVSQVIGNFIAGRYTPRPVSPDAIITEYAISSALHRYRASNGLFDSKYPQERRSTMYQPFIEAQRAIATDLELAVERPELLTTIGWNATGKLRGLQRGDGKLQELTTPDAVLTTWRDGKATYTGIEVELTIKTVGQYRRLLESYFRESPRGPISNIIYVSGDPAVERKVREAARGSRELGGREAEDYSQRIHFLPLYNLEGDEFQPASRGAYWTI